jgi:hypothetical protein
MRARRSSASVYPLPPAPAPARPSDIGGRHRWDVGSSPSRNARLSRKYYPQHLGPVQQKATTDRGYSRGRCGPRASRRGTASHSPRARDRASSEPSSATATPLSLRIRTSRGQHAEITELAAEGERLHPTAQQQPTPRSTRELFSGSPQGVEKRSEEPGRRVVGPEPRRPRNADA